MSWMQKNSQKIGRCQERQCIISKILWQGQVSWCWCWDKEQGWSRLPLPGVLLMATSWQSRAAQRAMGSEVCRPCGRAHRWMESVVVQPGCSSVDCSNASAKFLNSPRELNQQFWTLSSVLYWKEWQIGKNGLSRNQITKATRVRMKKMASGSTCSS